MAHSWLSAVSGGFGFPMGSTAAVQLPAEETLVTEVREGGGAGGYE